MKELKIEKVVFGGYGLAFDEEGTYFIENALPGDKIIPEITKKRKKTYFGKISEIISASPERTKPLCKYFGKCGGCQWLNFNYNAQLNSKTEIVKEQLKRIGNIETEVNPIISGGEQFEYRTKMEFALQKDSNNYILGLKERNSNNAININHCPISPNVFDKIRNSVFDVIKKLEIPVYNKNNKTDGLKHVVIRKSFSTGKTMLILVTNKETFPKEKEFKEELSSKIDIDSVIHVINSSDAVTLRGPYKTWKGKGVLEEEFDGFTFQISPTSFFQNNYYTTQKMLHFLRDYMKTKNLKEKTLLDLYCGVGLFSNYLAPFFKTSTGVEIAKQSIKAATSNSNLNDLKNTLFYAQDAAEYLRKTEKKYDYILVDPPRAGLDQEVLEKIAEKVKEEIIYISCDPATLARDLKIFTEKGFKVNTVQPFDMFPNTYHVETIVALYKKD